MFRAGHDPQTLLYASLGAAVMGIWSATSTSAGARAAAASAGTGRSSCSSRRPRTSRSCCCRSRSRCRRSASTRWSRRCSGGGSSSGSDLHIAHPLLFGLAVPVDDRLDRHARLPARGRRSSATAPPGRSGTCSSTRSGSSAASSSRSRSSRLGAADLVGARADLGHARDPGRGRCGGAPLRRHRRLRSRSAPPTPSIGVLAGRRRARSARRARDALADVNVACASSSSAA